MHQSRSVCAYPMSAKSSLTHSDVTSSANVSQPRSMLAVHIKCTDGLKCDMSSVPVPKSSLDYAPARVGCVHARATRFCIASVCAACPSAVNKALFLVWLLTLTRQANSEYDSRQASNNRTITFACKRGVCMEY
eukprot:1568032-Prymnesium_polylepis.2